MSTEQPTSQPRNRVWTPSPRVAAMLAAAMLAIGVAVGAAIGPAPEASLAGTPPLPVLIRALIAKEAAARAAATVAPSASSAPGAAARTRHRRHHRSAGGAAEPAATPASEGTSPPTSSTKSKPTPAKALEPVTKVWLIEPAGSSFEEALAAPASAPYLSGEALASGTLVTGWSALQAGAFASEAALLSSTEPSLVETILQPPCPEGAAAAQCAPGTPAGLAVADAFVKQAVATITASASFKTNGLIVVTFATIAPGAASELPAGSLAATLPSRPPAGALLISPFAAKGKRSTASFQSASPRKSLEALLHT